MLAICTITAIKYAQAAPQLSGILNPHKVFKTREDYYNHVLNNISFKELHVEKVTIRHGDNYWKIAKRNNTNIDSLIAINPYWNDLLARSNDTLLVPNKKGALMFIGHPSDVSVLKKKYNITDKEIIIEKLPRLYSLKSPFLKKRKPIAVFVKNLKPCLKFLPQNLAHQYTLRETFRSPLGGRFSSFFGSRRHPIFKRRRFHNGLDIAAPYGTWVGASRSGIVIATGWMGGYGKAIIIRHKNGYKTLYGHLSRIHTRRGKWVKAGTLIGKVGSTGYSTGPHLHFTLWHNGRLMNPMKILW